MCGIGGILGNRQGLDGSAMLQALHHRGPDRQANSEPSDGIWLCAARLAISDPTAAGNQPMQSSDGQVTIVFNGEIYNAPELRDRLAAKGVRLRSRCDTETILEGYRTFGDQITEALEGMFAFAIWDAPRKRLLLARDALGIKPLWLARPSGRLVFASEVRALLRCGAVPPRISPTAVQSYLAAGSVAEPDAILSAVEALAPGHRLVHEQSRERCARWFALPNQSHDLEPDAAARQVRALLDRSVRRCLHADVPVALLLSGGIDSAALAITAGRDAHVRSFHIRNHETSARRAAALARAQQFDHTEIRLSPEEVRDALPQLLAAQDQPSVDGVNTYFIARAIHQAGIKAAVTGLGADELFLGYPLHGTYVRLRAWQQRFGIAAAPLRQAARLGAWMRRGAQGGWRIDKLLALGTAESPRATYAAARALFPAALDPARSYVRGDPASDASPAAEVTRFDLSTYLVNTLLRDADVMSMAHGVELRVPMLDRGLVEEIVTLPDRLKLRRGRKKPLLVDAVPELPPEVERAPKEGFELPFDEWLLGPLRRPVEATLHDRSACAAVGLDAAATQETWARLASRRDRPSAFRVWALYSLLCWATTHGAKVA